MNSRHDLLLAAVLAVALTLLAHGAALRTPLIWDDVDVITPDGRLLSPRDIPSFFSYRHWVRPEDKTVRPYRPLRDAWLALLAGFAGEKPLPYHAANLLLQALNVWLVFVLARRLLPDRASACLAAALFAVNPMHAEVVSWAKNSAELLALTFGLLTTLAFMRAAEGTRRRDLWFWPGSLLCFVAAVLVKESVLPLPGMLVLWTLLWRRSAPETHPQTSLRVAPDVAEPHPQTSLRVAPEADKLEVAVAPARALLLTLPLWLIAVLSAIYQRVSTESGGPQQLAADVMHLNLPGRLCVAAATVAKYLRLAFFPIGPNPLHPLPRLPENVTFAGGAIVLMGLLCMVLLVLHARRRARGAFGLWWLLMGLGPVANLLAINGLRPLAEQRLYLPSVGVVLLLATVFTAVRSRPRLWGGAAVLVLASWTTLSIAAEMPWRDDLAFWRHAARAAPQNRQVQYNLGITCGQHGLNLQAVESYRRALWLRPDDFLSAYNLGNRLAAGAEGELARRLGLQSREMNALAARFYRQTLSANPRYVGAWNNLGHVYNQLGRNQEALRCYLRALQLNPDSATARLGVAGARLAAGLEAHAAKDYAKAATELTAGFEMAAALKKPPAPEHFLALADSLTQLGRTAQAAAVIQQGRELYPNDERLRQAVPSAP